jgi:hypothetical protein
MQCVLPIFPWHIYFLFATGLVCCSLLHVPCNEDLSIMNKGRFRITVVARSVGFRADMRAPQPRRTLEHPKWC